MAKRKKWWNALVTVVLALAYLFAFLGGGMGPVESVFGDQANGVAGSSGNKSSELNESVITGRVTNVDGHNVAGASIEWGAADTSFKNRQRVTTDQNGDYTLTLKSLAGRNRFAASAPGYLPQVSYSQIARGRQVENFVLSATPIDGHAIAGTVVDEQGQPVGGVRVEAFTPVVGFHSSFSIPTGRDYFVGPDRVHETDEQGRFRISDLPEGEVQLNLRSKHRHVNDQNYPVQEGLKITMSGSGQPGVIQGRIVDAATSLSPPTVNDIRIVPRYSPTNYHCSGDNGHFQLPTVATLDAEYLVYVYAKGYAAAQARLTALPVGSNEFTNIKLKTRPPLQGRLVDGSTGQPIIGAAILYGIADRASYIEWSDLQKYADGYHPLTFVQHIDSSQKGEFWFAEPEDGPRGTIIVVVDGYQRLILNPEARQLDDASGDLVIRLKRESAITGVVLKDGKPLPNASVVVSGRSKDGLDQMYESVRTDADGKYKYGRLAAGSYNVRGGFYCRIATVAETETVMLNLGEELGPIRIHGKAAPSIKIALRPEFDWDYIQFETEANSAGEYEITGLKPGKYRVSLHFAYSTGYISHDEREIAVEREGQQIDFLSMPSGERAFQPAGGSNSPK
jgi:hypothetical protein